METDEIISSPAKFIEVSGPSVEEERTRIYDAYYERNDNVFFAFQIEDGVALLVFVTYVLYHVISKLRGNDKNLHMYNFGMGLAVLGVAYYSVSFADDSA